MENCGLRPLRKDWTVAEITVNYRKKKKTGVIVGGTQDAANVFLSMWDKQLLGVQEQFCTLFLNRANEVIGFRLISTGTLSSTVIDISLIVTLALKCRAANIIVAHNHPSGSMRPSIGDLTMTRKLKGACELLDISLLDHLILAPGKFVSFADEELL